MSFGVLFFCGVVLCNYQPIRKEVKMINIDAMREELLKRFESFNCRRGIDMWYFIITADGFQVFEILPDCVKPSGMFLTASLKSSLDGVLSYVRNMYVGVDVDVNIDNATFDMDSTMVGVVKVVML